MSSSRRDMLGSAAAVLVLLNSPRAEAFLGIGENSEDIYKADTVRFLAWVVLRVYLNTFMNTAQQLLTC